MGCVCGLRVAGGVARVLSKMRLLLIPFFVSCCHLQFNVNLCKFFGFGFWFCSFVAFKFYPLRPPPRPPRRSPRAPPCSQDARIWHSSCHCR